MVLSFDILDLVSVYLGYFHSTCQRRSEHAQGLFVPLSYSSSLRFFVLLHTFLIPSEDDESGSHAG